jgi:hypothetical protein
MRLERHVGGLGRARTEGYLRERGWVEAEGAWRSTVAAAEPVSMKRALHHQLTADLSDALSVFGWKVVGYSPRGYVSLEDPKDASRCSLPAALRRQARRQHCPVGELTYSLFLSKRVGLSEAEDGAVPAGGAGAKSGRIRRAPQRAELELDGLERRHAHPFV